MTDRILVDAKEGAALLGISLRTFRYLIKTAGFPAAQIAAGREVTEEQIKGLTKPERIVLQRLLRQMSKGAILASIVLVASC